MIHPSKVVDEVSSPDENMRVMTEKELTCFRKNLRDFYIIIGIDHGYYAIKTPHVCFPTGLTGYDYEPYTMQNVLQYNGKFYVCGTGRQTLVRSKTSNDNYYLLTMAAIAQEIRYRRGERKTDVVLAAGLPLASFGREKKGFREYLFRKEQPLRFR